MEGDDVGERRSDRGDQAAVVERFAIEREFGYPVTIVRTAQLATVDLTPFYVLILPDDTVSRKYSDILGEKGIDRLDQWVNAGGTLIGISGAVSFLASEEVDLLSVAAENSARTSKSLQTRPRSDGRVPGQVLTDEAQFREAIVAGEEQPDPAPGAILRARLNPEHWLTAGLKGTVAPASRLSGAMQRCVELKWASCTPHAVPETDRS